MPSLYVGRNLKPYDPSDLLDDCPSSRSSSRNSSDHYADVTIVDPLPRTLTDRIPAEIYDRIIDHLHAAKPALSACALVCKAWVPSTRVYHLSSPTTFASGDGTFAPLPLVIDRRTARALLPLLASPHCTLHAHLRSIAIRPGKRVHLRHFAPPLLVGLERVVVCPTSYAPGRDDLVQWVAGFAGSLAEIVLVGVGGVSLARFVGMLGEVRGLRHVGLVDVRWAEKDLDVFVKERKEGESALLLPHLRSLVLEDSSIKLIDWLVGVTRGGAPKIASLDLRQTSAYQTIDMAQLITSYYRTLGGALEELDLYEPHHAPLDLQHTPNLRQIWFHNVIIGMSATGQWVTDALTTVVPSSRVRVVVLDLFSEHVDDEYPDNDWICYFDPKAFARVLLDRAKFPQLERVELLVDDILMLWARWLVTPLTAHEQGHPEVVVRVVKRDRAPRFDFVECGRLEERAQRWWELPRDGNTWEWDGSLSKLKTVQ